MRIAQVAPPFESVPPSRYGGTERVVYTLTETLVRRGHQVTLFASGDSVTSAELVPIVDTALWHHPRYRDHVPFWSLTLAKVYRRAAEFDVIHSHLDYLTFPIARTVATPTVTTLHGRLDLLELQPIFNEFTDQWVVSISNNQRRPLPQARWAATVYHGLALDEFVPSYTPGSYLAFLGRISPEKGLDRAIEVAKRAGIPLKIAARLPLDHPIDPSTRLDHQYYEQVIKPLLNHPLIEYVGEVSSADRNAFLRGALALLFPIDWPEPFGLVMAEAMACGTPVIARRAGSVPEVVVDGVTGFICDSVEEMVLACDRVSNLDRRACRSHVEQHFSARRMAEGYERVYAMVREAALARESRLWQEVAAASEVNAAGSLGDGIARPPQPAAP